MDMEVDQASSSTSSSSYRMGSSRSGSSSSEMSTSSSTSSSSPIFWEEESTKSEIFWSEVSEVDTSREWPLLFRYTDGQKQVLVNMNFLNRFGQFDNGVCVLGKADWSQEHKILFIDVMTGKIEEIPFLRGTLLEGSREGSSFLMKLTPKEFVLYDNRQKAMQGGYGSIFQANLEVSYEKMGFYALANSPTKIEGRDSYIVIQDCIVKEIQENPMKGITQNNIGAEIFTHLLLGEMVLHNKCLGFPLFFGNFYYPYTFQWKELEGKYCIFMEKMDGTLFRFLAEKNTQKDKLEKFMTSALDCIVQLSFSYLGAYSLYGFTHGDMKNTNVAYISMERESPILRQSIQLIEPESERSCTITHAVREHIWKLIDFGASNVLVQLGDTKYCIDNDKNFPWIVCGMEGFKKSQILKNLFLEILEMWAEKYNLPKYKSLQNIDNQFWETINGNSQSSIFFIVFQIMEYIFSFSKEEQFKEPLYDTLIGEMFKDQYVFNVLNTIFKYRKHVQLEDRSFFLYLVQYVLSGFLPSFSIPNLPTNPWFIGLCKYVHQQQEEIEISEPINTFSCPVFVSSHVIDLFEEKFSET